MESSVRKIFYYIGIIATLYFLFTYVLPFLLRIIGLAFKAVVMVIMWGAVAFALFLLVMYVINYIKKMNE